MAKNISLKKADILQRCADMKMRGFTLSEIASQLGITVNSVRKNLNQAKADFVEKSAWYVYGHIKDCLAKIELIEKAAWIAYEHSGGTLYYNLNGDIDTYVTIEKTEKIVPYYDKRTRTYKERIEKTTKQKLLNGDPRYLDIILKCVAERRNLLTNLNPDKGDNRITIEVVQAIPEYITNGIIGDAEDAYTSDF